MSQKLDITSKVDIVLSREKSLREIAADYEVHHSSIDDLFKESAEVLSRYWQEKSTRKGRPAKIPHDDNLNFEAEEKELMKQLSLKQMRIDWLELQLKFKEDRAVEAKQKKAVQLKKKRS